MVHSTSRAVLICITLLSASALVSAVTAGPPLGMNNHQIRGSQISASSYYLTGNRACAPQHARLNDNAGAGSWCAQRNRVGEFLQIDFHGLAEINAVSTQGRNPNSRQYRNARQWVTRYGLQYSVDGQVWETYTDPGQHGMKSFAGNSNSNGVVTHNLKKPIRAKYLRFVVQGWRSHISMRAEVYGKMISKDKLGRPLGVGSGLIRDSKMSASTTYNCNGCLDPENGRLNSNRGAGAWAAVTSDPKKWIQIDLRGDTRLTGVATQARNRNSQSHRGAKQWVTKYKLQYSMDGTTWTTYKAKDGETDRIFRGNQDWVTTVSHPLNRPVRCKHVRIQIVSYKSHPSMRVELYGRLIRPDRMGRALGMQSKRITNSQISTSSTYPAGGGGCEPKDARLKSTAGAGGWCAKSNRVGEYLEVDFGGATTVNGVATQGRNPNSQRHRGAKQWVTKYQLQYSADGIEWATYSKGDIRVTFDGNHDQNTPRVHYLDPPIRARFVRIRVLSWHSHISMRAEFYGAQHDKIRTGPSIGLQNGLLPSRNFKSSSRWSNSWGPWRAGLNKNSCWIARRNDMNQWIQVDLGRLYELGGVATQGRPRVVQQYVKKYRIRYSVNGRNWFDYKESGRIKIFTGNSDNRTVRKNAFIAPFLARYFRLIPTSWSNHISMRMELYRADGRRVPSLSSLGPSLRFGSSSSPVKTVRSNGVRSGSYAASLAVLRSARQGGAWCARARDGSLAGSYLEFDFGSKPISVGGIASQGRSPRAQVGANLARINGGAGGEWVTSYRIRYATDAHRSNWADYKENGVVREFRGNLDPDTVTKHAFSASKNGIRATAIRIVPTGEHGWTCMRVQLFSTAAAEEERNLARIRALKRKEAADRRREAAIKHRAILAAKNAKIQAARDIARARAAAEALARARTQAVRIEAQRAAALASKRISDANKIADKLRKEKAAEVADKMRLRAAHAKARADADRERRQKAAMRAKAEALRKKVEQLEAEVGDGRYTEERFMNALRKVAGLEEMIRQLRVRYQSIDRNFERAQKESSAKDEEVEALRKEVRSWKMRLSEVKRRNAEMKSHISRRAREDALAAAIAAKAASGGPAVSNKTTDAPATAAALADSSRFNGPDRFPKPQAHPGTETGKEYIPSVTRQDFERAKEIASATFKKADASVKAKKEAKK